MTGYRTKIAASYIEDDDFMLTYGDAVSDINIDNLVNFHRNHGKIGTVSGVYPPSRFGDLVIRDQKVIKFKQQLKDIENSSPINGGYFVFKKEFIDKIPNDINIDLEKQPINSIVQTGDLNIFEHTGFWHSMDTYRDNIQLNKMWLENPKWKIW